MVPYNGVPQQAPDGASVNLLNAIPYATHIVDRPTTPPSADVDVDDEDKDAMQESMADKPAEDVVSSSGGSSPHLSVQGVDQRPRRA